MNWLYNNKKYLPKKAQESFLDIMNKSYNVKPYKFYEIKDLVPDNFDYSDESIGNLKNEYLENENE